MQRIPFTFTMALSIALVAACSEQPTAPRTDTALPTAGAKEFREDGAAVQWNGIARGLTLAHQQPTPIHGQRIYAYLNLAIYDAVVAVDHARRHPSPQGAAGGAAVTVLSFFFPTDAAALERQLAAQQSDQQSGEHSGSQRNGKFEAGVAIGRSIGLRVVAAIQTDNFDAPFTGIYPTDPVRFWTSAPGIPPVLPGLRDMRPFFLTSADQFLPAPAPAVGTAEFAAALAAVRAVAANRTPEQMTAPLTLLFGAGTSGISGRWNQEASDLIESHDLDERRAAHVFALMHMAAMDAYIACWEAKYHPGYFVIRPTQADPTITRIVGLPNHPSYPSGHSCTSGAASEVLAILFPDAQEQVRDLSDAIGIARFWGGVHYLFDVNVGLTLGRTVAHFAAAHDVHRHEAYLIP
jgi:PAP2 superfamily protein